MSSGRSLATMAFGVATTASLVANVLLIRQNRRLSALAVNSSARRTEVDPLRPGEIVPTLVGTDLHGRETRITFSGNSSRTLLLVFAPGCEVCEENAPNWAMVVEVAERERLRVVTVSLVPEVMLAEEFLSRNGLARFENVIGLAAQSRKAYRLTQTPQTIILGTDGRVEGIWTGIVAGARRDELESILKAGASGAAPVLRKD